MTVETDASDYAIVGILSVTTLDLEIRPIAFHSQSLHDTEKNYDTHDKKLLAVFSFSTTWANFVGSFVKPGSKGNAASKPKAYTSTLQSTCTPEGCAARI